MKLGRFMPVLKFFIFFSLRFLNQVDVILTNMGGSLPMAGLCLSTWEYKFSNLPFKASDLVKSAGSSRCHMGVSARYWTGNFRTYYNLCFYNEQTVCVCHWQASVRMHLLTCCLLLSQIQFCQKSYAHVETIPISLHSVICGGMVKIKISISDQELYGLNPSLLVWSWVLGKESLHSFPHLTPVWNGCASMLGWIVWVVSSSHWEAIWRWFTSFTVLPLEKDIKVWVPPALLMCSWALSQSQHKNLVRLLVLCALTVASP